MNTTSSHSMYLSCEAISPRLQKPPWLRTSIIGDVELMNRNSVARPRSLEQRLHHAMHTEINDDRE